MKVFGVSFSNKNTRSDLYANKYAYLYTGEVSKPCRPENSKQILKASIGILTVGAVLLTLFNLKSGKNIFG